MNRLLVSCVVLFVMLVVAPAAPAMTVDPVAVSARACTITGTAGPDRLGGTAHRDVICGLGGADKLRGNGGADVLRGAGGADLLQGRKGADRLDGGSGDDKAFGGAGADNLRGGRGDDGLGGGFGPDRLSGGPGRDVALYGQRGRPVRVTIGKGANDGVRGEHDNVRGDVEDVRGGRRNDVLIGNGAGNELFGGGGRDRLVGKGGSDVLDAGGGNDRIDAREPGGATGTAAQAGSVDHVICGSGEDTALVDPEDVVDPDCEHVVGAGTPPSPPVNHAPTGIALSNAGVAENEPVGTTVGTLSASDPDPGDTASFALVAGAGSTDNGSFQIVGSQLRTAAVFNYEAKHTYSVRIRATDHGTPAGQIVRTFTINVSDANEAPTGLTLSNATLPENEPVGTDVGTLSVSDVDAGQTHTFTLVAGTGDADNGKFHIAGSTLETAAVLDFEAQPTYHIRVRATDSGTPAMSVEAEFTITVTDTLEPPTADDVSGVTTAEDTPVTVTLSASDPEGDDPLTFATASPSHGSLGPVGAVTCSHATPNVCTADVVFTPAGNYNGPAGFSHTASDGAHDSLPATVSITVNPVNDTPTASDGTRTTDEDTPLTLNLAGLVSDVETSDANLTYEIVSQPAHGTATATTYTPDADFNGSDSLTYKVTDRGDPDNCGAPGPSCDAPETSTTQTVSITVNPVNDTPTASDGSRTTDEDTPVALDLASLASDLETADGSLTYTIVSQPAHGTATATTYTPDADFNGTDTLTYQVTDRGDPDNCGAPGPGCAAAKTSTTGTVTITVNPINDAPVATPGSRTTDEDTSLTLNLAGLVSDVETSDANLTYEIVSPPAHGTATATTYTPDADFNGTDSLTYKVTDRGDPDNCTGGPPACNAPKTSTTETVSITVNPINDTPLAPDAARTTDEDTPLTIDLAALASDLETADANLTFSVTQPAHGTVTGTGASRTYTPAADFNGTDSFTYTAQDRGDPDNCSAPAPACDETNSATGTITITVGAVNDAPVNALPAGPVAAQANVDKPITGVSVADADAGTDLVEVKLSVLNGTLTVSTGVPLGLVLGDVVGNGTSSVTITATLAKINTTFANATGLVYRGASTGPDTLTMTTNDLGHNGSGGAKTDTDTLAIMVNSPPVAAGQSVTTNEDTAKTITLSASDADGDASTFAIATGPSHGSLGPIGAVTCNAATPKVCTADVIYTPTADYNGPDSFTFTAADAFATSAPATVNITVSPVNDVPKLQNIEAGALAYTENDPATLITATTTVSDIDSANFDTGTLTVDYAAASGTADDRLEIVNQGQIATSGSNVTFGGTTIGTFTGGTGTTPLVVTLNANASAAATEALVRAVAFRNVSDAPSTAARTVRFVLTDGDGGTSAPATRNVTVTAVNDAPVLANIEAGALAYTENDPATAITSSLTVTDPDSNITSATVQITAPTPVPAEDVLAFVNQPGITGNYNPATGVLTLSGNASPAAYQSALRAVTYRNTSENPSTATRTISFQAQDAQSAASNTQSRNVTVTAVNDPPVADDETFDAANGAIGNTTLVGNDPSDGPPSLSSPKKTITADILAGDTDVEGQTLVVVPVTNQATADGGQVTIEADGDFVYTPKAGTSCTDHSDSFDYTVSDQNATGPGPTPGTDTGTVTIAIAGCVWYVDNTAAAGGGGTSLAPFSTIDPAETASAANDTVFVFDGNNSAYSSGNTGYTTNAGERLIGEDVGLTVDPDGPGGPLTAQVLHPANPGAKPTLTATGADVIDLSTGNEIRGFVIDPSGAGGGIAGGTGDTGATIDGVDITDTGTAGTQPGLELNGTTGTFNVSNLTVTTTAATGVLLNNAGTVNFAATGTISLTSAGGPALSAANTALSGTIDSTTTTSSPTTGISLTTTTGSLTLDDVNLTTTGTGLTLNNANNVTVNNTGDADVSSSGRAIDLTNGPTTQPNASDVALDQVSSSGGTVGINIDGIGAGTFSAAGGTLSGHSAAELDINGGDGNITYPGTIGNGSGLSAQITGRSGGTVALAGNINDSSDAGGGIDMSTNSGGTFNFSGATKTLNTTTGAAFSSTGSSPTINLTGGGLDIDTTTGSGLAASGGGTVTVTTGANPNTVDAVSATALNVANTTIGAAGATFQSISSGNTTPSAADNPVNGIVLNNTGANGGLTVTGTASANSGGTIQNISSQGISLTTTRAPSFNRMNIQSTGGSGVRGTTAVNGFSFTNGTINNSGTGGGNQESSIAFNDPTGSATDAKVTGTVTITGNTLTNALWHGVSILQFAGALDDVNISNNTLTSGTTTATGGNSFGSGIQLFAGGVASSVANVTRAELNNNTITNFPGGVLIAAQCGTSNGTGPTGVCGTPGSATNDIEIKNNILNGGGTTPNGAGGVILPNQLMLLTVNGRGQGQFTVQNNGTVADPLSGSAGNHIDISAGGAVTVQATVTGNQMDAAGQTVSGTSGIAAGVGPFTVTGPTTLSTATLYATVQNNSVKNSAGSGIRLNVNAGSPTLNGIVTGNTVTTPISATYGMQVVEGNNAGFTGHANVQVSGNTSTGGTGGGNTFPGIGLRKFGTATNEFSIVGLTPTPATNAQMESYVAGLNTSTPGTFGTNGVAAVNGSSSNWTAIASVPQPPAVP